MPGERAGDGAVLADRSHRLTMSRVVSGVGTAVCLIGRTTSGARRPGAVRVSSCMVVTGGMSRFRGIVRICLYP